MFEQNRFIVRLRQRLNAERNIVAAWFFGSFGRNTADPFSDLNICLLYRDRQTQAAAWAARRTFCQDILAYVSAKSVDTADNQHSVLFDSGTLAHFRFCDWETLRPTHLDREIKPLKDDTSGWLDSYEQQCHFLGQQVVPISAETVADVDDRFWILYWNVYRQTRRGAPANAFGDYVQLLASSMPTLLSALPPEHPAHQQLISAHFSADASATLHHLRQLLAAYLAARQAIVEKYRIDFRPNATFERNIERTLKK